MRLRRLEAGERNRDFPTTTVGHSPSDRRLLAFNALGGRSPDSETATRRSDQLVIGLGRTSSLRPGIGEGMRHPKKLSMFSKAFPRSGYHPLSNKHYSMKPHQQPRSPGDQSTRLQRGNRLRAGLLSAALFAGSLAPTHALNIVVNFDAGLSDAPTYDPAGTDLIAIMEAAAETWESIILDAGTVTIDFYYETGTGGLANASLITTDAGGRPLTGRIRFDTDVSTGLLPNRTWFFDDTPKTDEHWDMISKTYRDLDPAEQAARFNPSDIPPDELEVSYRGELKPTAPAEAQGNFDIYTSALHEIGHVLGMAGVYADPADTEIETQAVFTGGNDFAALLRTDPSDGSIELGHFAWTNSDNNPLMCGSCAETDARRLPTAQDIICVASRGGWNTIDLPRVDFFGATDADFNFSDNWIGDRIPNSNNRVFCRHADRIKLIGDATVKTLFIGSGTTFETEGHDFTTTSDTDLEDDQLGAGLTRPFLVVEQGSLYETSDLHIRHDGLVEVQDDSDIMVNDDLLNEGTLRGYGTVEVTDNFLNNGGLIKPRFDALLTITGTDGKINLDGQSPEEGTVECTQGNLEVLSTLADPFGSDMLIGAGYFASFPRGWTLGINGVLTLDGGPTLDDADRAILKGEGVYEGTIEVDEECLIISDRAVFDPIDGLYYLPTHTFADGVEVNLPDAGDRLALKGSTIESGAVFTGSGIVVNGEGGQMDLLDGANLGVKLTNGGNELRFNGAGTIGNATVDRMNFLEIGTVRFDINDQPDTGEFDHLEAVNDVTIRGTLEVDFSNHPLPPIGTRWRIIDGTSVSGIFTEVDIIGLSFLRTAHVEYFPNGVDVVIDGPLLRPELITWIPREFEAGTTFDIPFLQGQRGIFRIFSSNPEILAIDSRTAHRDLGEGTDSVTFTPRAEGQVTLLLETLNEKGELEISELEVKVKGGRRCDVQAQLLDPIGQMDDGLGHSSAIFGNIAISGAPFADPGGRADAGKAVIWERQAGGWVTAANIAPAFLQPGDRTGAAVELINSLAMIGMPGRGADVGQVQILGRSPAGVWGPLALLSPPANQPGLDFGSSIIAAGNLIFVGAPGDNMNGADAGAVYVFQRNGLASWTGHSVIRASNGAANDRFGSEIAVGHQQIVIGAPGQSNGAGAVYRFTNVGGSLTEQDIFTLSTGAPGDRFGRSLAVGPGPTIMAGAPFHDSTAGPSDCGAVAVFEEVAGAWTETGLVTPSSPAAGDRFGWDLAISDCGFIASAPWRDEVSPDAGSMHRIGHDGTDWIAGIGRVPPDVRPNDRHGYSLDGHERCYASGSRLDDDQAQDAGAVYVWCEGAGRNGNIFDPQGGNGDPQGGPNNPQAWLEQQFPNGVPEGDLSKDDDGDGRSRLWEYIQGTAADQRDFAPLRFTRDQDGRRQLKMSFDPEAAKRYRIILETSNDGRFWRTSREIEPEAESILTQNENITALLARGVRQEFYRVRIDGFRTEGLK